VYINKLLTIVVLIGCGPVLSLYKPVMSFYKPIGMHMSSYQGRAGVLKSTTSE
jgi:hypothetical protein